MVKVRISKEEYVRTEKILNGVPHFQYPDFIEVEAEPVVTFKMDSSYEVPRQNYTGHPLPVEVKCEHESTNCHTGKCWDCGFVPMSEELRNDFDTTSQVINITDKLNELIRAVNLLRK